MKENSSKDLSPEKAGTLYIVATPIGNSADLSPRARKILEEVDLIAAEDTRRSMVLMNKLGIRNQLVSNHKFNEHGKAGWFVEQLQSGKNVALISDAGTPCVSDPGNELVQAALSAGIRVSPLPGCCAAVSLLSVSGFDLTSFAFLGFFPRERADRLRLLDAMRRDPLTAVFVLYESPKRIMQLVDFLIEEKADCRLFLMNDMTKLHEMDFRGTPEEVKEKLILKGNYDKGEYAAALELSPAYRYRKEEHTVSAEAMLVDALLREGDMKAAIASVLQDLNNSYSKNELKAASLRLKKMFQTE